MMREILFRGKHIDDGEWVYGGYCKDDCYGNSLGERVYISTWNTYGLGFIENIRVNPNTVGQYIGQKDKNGKKIFEGDILHCIFNHRKYLVKINEYGVYTRDERGEELKLGRINNDFEIVGNAHDNPELMGGK